MLGRRWDAHASLTAGASGTAASPPASPALAGRGLGGGGDGAGAGAGYDDRVEQLAAAVYPLYQRHLRASGKVDFGDLLLCSVNLLTTQVNSPLTQRLLAGFACASEFFSQRACSVATEHCRILPPSRSLPSTTCHRPNPRIRATALS